MYMYIYIHIYIYINIYIYIHIHKSNTVYDCTVVREEYLKKELYQYTNGKYDVMMMMKKINDDDSVDDDYNNVKESLTAKLA